MLLMIADTNVFNLFCLLSCIVYICLCVINIATCREGQEVVGSEQSFDELEQQQDLEEWKYSLDHVENPTHI